MIERHSPNAVPPPDKEIVFKNTGKHGSCAVLPRSGRFVLLAASMVLLSPQHNLAQIGLGGFSAVMTVPTARMQPDRMLAIGFGFIPQPYALYAAPYYDNLAYFANIGFLPFLEISLRGTLALRDSLQDIGDRMASARLQLLAETRKRPALAVGIHDLIAIQGREGWCSALYAVVTKQASWSRAWRMEASVGYGVDWLKARSHEFNGPFGGASLGYRQFLFIKGEYDSRKLNYGLTLQVKKLLAATLVFLDVKTVAYGANLQKQL